jgi:hypothetical protein
MKRAMVSIVLALIATVGALAQVNSGKPIAVTVTPLDGDAMRITSPSIAYWSNEGYLLGGAFQSREGIYVTDPIWPPAGVTIKRRLIKWRDIKSLEWDPRPNEVNQEYYRNFKVTVTTRDDRSEKVFVWQPMRDRADQKLGPCNFKITGTLSIQGTNQDVVLTGDPNERGECRSTPFSRLDFEWQWFLIASGHNDASGLYPETPNTACTRQRAGSPRAAGDAQRWADNRKNGIDWED